MANPQYVFHMSKLSKAYAGGKQVLKDISLSFLPGAKIGVVGLNGSGKSTLLKIMAGQISDFIGEAWAADGVKVGYLPQEPELDPSKDVLGNAMEGVAEKKALLDRYNELVREMTDRSQFIVITHNKRTMESADNLYGVTMQEPGVSKLVTVNLAKLGAKSGANVVAI